MFEGRRVVFKIVIRNRKEKEMNWGKHKVGVGASGIDCLMKNMLDKETSHFQSTHMLLLC